MGNKSALTIFRIMIRLATYLHPQLLVGVLFLFLAGSYALGQQTAQHLQTQVCRQVDASYLVYLPQTYKTTSAQFPLLMYLHGGSLRGDTLDKLRRMGLPHLLENQPDFPFVVVSPQCPKGEIWTDTHRLIAILDEVVKAYRIDTSRVYLSGHSMGGRGTLYLAYKHPERFSAIAALSPLATIDEWVSKLKHIPIWLLHGSKDQAVPVGESRHLVELLQQAGGLIKYTELGDRDHFILDIYDEPAFYDWLLRHHK